MSSLKTFGLRVTHLIDCDGNAIPCSVSLTLTGNFTRTESKCNDRTDSATRLNTFTVAAEEHGYTPEAMRVLFGIDPVSFNHVIGGATVASQSVILPEGHLMPRFDFVGKMVGQNGDSDLHVRVFGARAESFELGANQDEFTTVSWSGVAEGRDGNLIEFVKHDSVVDVSDTPAPEAYMPVLWYDAQSCQEFYTDGDPVPTIFDRSANAWNATQGTLANQPRYDLDGFNGQYPAFVFDGAGDAVTAADVDIDAPFTKFMVVEAQAPALAGDMVSATFDVAVATTGLITVDTVPQTGTETVADWKLLTVISDGTSSYILLDNEVDTSAATMASDIGALTLGVVEMNLGELRVIGRAVSLTEALSIGAQLKEKWGIS